LRGLELAMSGMATFRTHGTQKRSVSGALVRVLILNTGRSNEHALHAFCGHSRHIVGQSWRPRGVTDAIDMFLLT
jgi:hypothetical protein